MANKSSIYMEGATLDASRYRTKALELFERCPGVTEYGVSVDPPGIKFATLVNGSIQLDFLLKVDVVSVRRQYRKMRAKPLAESRAEKIAWAQLYEWAKSQVAMIEGGAIGLDEAFMSRMLYKGEDPRLQGLTMAEVQRHQLQLAAPAEASC